MVKSYNIGAFYLTLVCVGLVAYSLYSNINNTWLIAPPNYIMLLMSLLALFFGMIGFKDKRNWRTKTRSWLSIMLASLTSIVLFFLVSFALLFSFGVNEHIKTAHSPDGDYTIDFYRYDPGAAGAVGIRGELSGPLWFKKRIYHEKRIEEINVEWIDNSTISINNHILDLKKGEIFGY